jgi:hypothetical protein
MYVDSVQKADRVAAERILNEAVQWLPRRGAEEAIVDVFDRLPAAISPAAGEVDDLPSELPELVARRAKQMRELSPPMAHPWPLRAVRHARWRSAPSIDGCSPNMPVFAPVRTPPSVGWTGYAARPSTPLSEADVPWIFHRAPR